MLVEEVPRPANQALSEIPQHPQEPRNPAISLLAARSSSDAPALLALRQKTDAQQLPSRSFVPPY
jgi:hypothetical protein